jgi:hypothetical protein
MNDSIKPVKVILSDMPDILIYTYGQFPCAVVVQPAIAIIAGIQPRNLVARLQ